MSSVCHLCHNTNLPTLFTKNECEVARCTKCSLVQITSIPSQEAIEAIYAESYFDRGKYVLDAAAKREQSRRLHWMEKSGLKEGAKVLDAGCATGDFIETCKDKYDIWGLDISEHAINIAKERFPEIANKLSAGRVEDQDYPDGFFDAIVLWDVLEHLPDPLAVINSLARILKPGGIISLSTPNVGALTPKLMGKYWAFMTPPEHLFLFDKKSLSMLFEKANFSLTKWVSKGKWANVAFLTHKLHRMFPKLVPHSLFEQTKKSFLKQLILYVPTGDIQYASAIKQ